MADSVYFDDYTGLKLAVAKWLNRGDLAAQIPEFIRLAEVEIARVLRSKTYTREITISAVTTSLPAEVAELRSVSPKTANVTNDLPLTILSSAGLAERRRMFGGIAGTPRYGKVVDNVLTVAPEPDDEYTFEIEFYAKMPYLSSSVATNFVLQNDPDLYLYGALLVAAPYLKNDERIAIWRENFDRAKDQRNTARSNEENGVSQQQAPLPINFG